MLLQTIFQQFLEVHLIQPFSWSYNENDKLRKIQTLFLTGWEEWEEFSTVAFSHSKKRKGQIAYSLKDVQQKTHKQSYF